MNRIIDSYNLAAGTAITLLTALFGAHWYIFALFLLFNVLDYVTGWHKANKLKQESSKKGAQGAIKKVMLWVIVLVAFMIPQALISLGNDIIGIDLAFLRMLGWFTLATLMVNEARSILENLAECGYNVPAFLVKGLAVTQKLIDAKTDAMEGEKKDGN